MHEKKTIINLYDLKEKKTKLLREKTDVRKSSNPPPPFENLLSKENEWTKLMMKMKIFSQKLLLWMEYLSQKKSLQTMKILPNPLQIRT